MKLRLENTQGNREKYIFKICDHFICLNKMCECILIRPQKRLKSLLCVWQYQRRGIFVLYWILIYCIFISLKKGSKKSEIKEFFSKNIYVYILLPKYVHFKLKSALKKEHNSDLIYIWSMITTGNKNFFFKFRILK